VSCWVVDGVVGLVSNIICRHEHRRTYNHGKPKFILDGKEVVASMFEAQQFKAIHGQDSTVRTALV